MLERLADKRIAIWGYGEEGRAALQTLRRVFPDKRLTVIVRDREIGDPARTPVADDTLRVVSDSDLSHALCDVDVVIKSPGISPYRPEVASAREQGVEITSGTRLWFGEHGGDGVICITGTKGKSTTAALVTHLLESTGHSAVLCGNIGTPLLKLLQPERLPDRWVMELSSYQTQDFDAAPDLAVVLNLYPEHLDWHGSEDAYYRDKLNLLKNPGPRHAILNGLDRTLLELTTDVVDTTLFNVDEGLHVANDAVMNGQEFVLKTADIGLRGAHNHSNVCAALTVMKSVGVDPADCVTALTTFTGLPHRLSVLGRRNGLTYVDDSISTTPHSTLAALDAWAGTPVTVLVGGYDRGVDWTPFAKAVAGGSAHAVVTMPDNGPRIAALLGDTGSDRVEVREAEDLDTAVAIAAEITPEDGVVLLSPGAPSFGQFRDYRERGERFASACGFPPA